MNRGLIIGLGLFLSLAGLVFVFNSFSNITGYIIIKEMGQGESSLFGFVIAIGGIIAFIYGLENLNFSHKKTKK